MRKYLNWVEISERNLIYNLRQFRQYLSTEVKIMAVVKSNAYGHGLREIASIVSKNGVDWLGVNSFEEGVILRRAGIKLPILVLGYILPINLPKTIKNNLSFVVFRMDILEKIAKIIEKTGEKARIHLKIETGTNRLGIKPESLPNFLNFLKKNPNIILEGIYTHFANIEDAPNFNFARHQIFEFKKAAMIIREEKIARPLIHAACSAAAILYPQTLFDLARIGIGLYGLWSSKETKISAKERKIKINLRPVLNWKTRVVQIKNIKSGETIGYGRTFRASRETKMAVVPVGYWDGYDRRLSNTGRVLIKGEFCPVVGRVCMNMMMVDVTDIGGISIGNEVVLIGKQKANEITADEIAQKIGTINYEVAARINPLLPRIIS